MNKIIQGDCLEVLKTLGSDSIDSVITDPPYELGFMGKYWDNTGIANNVEMWKECLRVLKPGGHLLSFSGTRTYHQMAVAIENAGFEVRDMIEWVYGSGFPKSLNIGKAVDKLQGNEREVVGKDKGHTGGRVKNHEGLHDDDNYEWKGEFNITKGTSEWEGWGTALKPAHEPICMARKPIEGTVAENVLKYGTGGINIDESRVDTTDNLNGGAYSGGERGDGDWKDKSGFKNDKLEEYKQPTGRFPANLIHDNSEEVRECFPETKGEIHNKKSTGNSMFMGDGVQGSKRGFSIKDNGNASRFFKSIIYQAKASKSERNKGCEGLEEKQLDESRKEGNPGGDNPRNRGINKATNFHPTVKPIALMEYLINMVTRQGGIVLDPFMGSGSTGVACKRNGFGFIGIEKEFEYCKIAEKRIEQECGTLF